MKNPAKYKDFERSWHWGELDSVYVKFELNQEVGL